MPQSVLGLSFDYHDAAAALTLDGEIVAAAQEERFNREKHSARLPEQAIRFCLNKAGLKPGDVDRIAFYERPLVKLDRIRQSRVAAGAEGEARFIAAAGRWLAQGRLSVGDRLAALGLPADRLVFVDHHLSHAASAFYCSPFEEAAVVTLDGVGEWETTGLSLGRGRTLDKILSVNYPHSVGLFYSALTAFLGFEVNEGEYKVMGMAGFGVPRFADRLIELFRLSPDGGFRLDVSPFDFDALDGPPFGAKLAEMLGPPRPPESPFDPAGDAASRHYADIAASAQRCAEVVIRHVVESAVRTTGVRNVCLAGGVALNSVANHLLQKELGCRLFVQPAAGDAGGALGAALAVHHAAPDARRSPPLATPYLGAAFGDDVISPVIDRAGLDFESYDDDAALVAAVSRRLAEGHVVGWFQGAAEWGPRALGARSILASPLTAEMQLRVNEKIKFREPFRPFAPSTLAERAAEYFHLPADAAAPTAPERYMLSVCPVREEAKARIPAVVHVDGTARVHLADPAANPLFCRLIEAFGALTGESVLLNTSFNLRGEAMVNHPADAMATFLASGIDYLALGRHVVRKFGLPA